MFVCLFWSLKDVESIECESVFLTNFYGGGEVVNQRTEIWENTVLGHLSFAMGM